MHVVQNIAKFKDRMLRIMEDYMADFDQQYLIELDANKNPKVIFQVLIHKIVTVDVWCAAFQLNIYRVCAYNIFYSQSSYFATIVTAILPTLMSS